MLNKKKYRRKSPQVGEAGFTLIEMIIVIVLASILGIFVFGVLTKCLVAQKDMQVRKERNDDAVLSMEKMNREVREAKDIIFAGNISGVPLLVFEKNITSSVDPNRFIKYVLDASTNNLLRLSVADSASIPWTVHTAGDVIATDVSFFWGKNVSLQKINIQLEFTDGSDWQTHVFPRNYGL